MRHLCQAHARPAHARNHHHHTTTASLHPCAMAVLRVNQQLCACVRCLPLRELSRDNVGSACRAACSHVGPRTPLVIHNLHLLRRDLFSHRLHTPCASWHLPWPRRVLIAKCFNLLNLRIVRDVCTHARVCERALAVRSCMPQKRVFCRQ